MVKLNGDIFLHRDLIPGRDFSPGEVFESSGATVPEAATVLSFFIGISGILALKREDLFEKI